MKRFLLPVAIVALAIPASNARMVVTRDSKTSPTKVSLLDNDGSERSVYRKAAKTSESMGEVKLIKTDIKIADVLTGRVKLDRPYQEMTDVQLTGNTPHSGASHNFSASSAILAETMDGFTLGSQSSPVAVTNSGGTFTQKVLQSTTDNLYGWGVYSLGGGLGALMGSANEFRIIDIQASKDIYIGMWVGALQSGAAIDLNEIEGTNGTSFLMNSSPTAIPYDGNIYWLETSANGKVDKNKQPVSANISLLIMGTDGSNDTNLAFAGIWLDGQRYSGNTGGGGGGTVTPPSTVEVGVPSNVQHNISFDRQSFTVSYTSANNATHHELYTFNDVYGPATANYLNVDWSPLSVGATDYQNPLLTYYAQDVALSEIPGGMCHWPVLVNGALGFGYLYDVVNSTNSWAGFETSDYDLTATNGVATISFEMYPTDYTVFVLNEYAYNKSTGRYDLVDQAELDGSQIQWNAWDQFTVTLDQLNANTYDLEHVYFMFGLVSESEDTSIPSFLYFNKMQISAAIPSGKAVYYLHGDRETQGSGTITEKGDVDNNNFNYLIRGNYHGDSHVYGEWATHPEDGTFYVLKDYTGVNTIRTADADEPARYFDLQGRQVTNPAPGMYIVKRGNTIAKEVVK